MLQNLSGNTVLCRKLQHGSFSKYRALEGTDQETKAYNHDFSLLQLYNGFNLPNLPNVKTACLPTRGVPRNKNNVSACENVIIAHTNYYVTLLMDSYLMIIASQIVIIV